MTMDRKNRKQITDAIVAFSSRLAVIMGSGPHEIRVDHGTYLRLFGEVRGMTKEQTISEWFDKGGRPEEPPKWIDISVPTGTVRVRPSDTGPR